VDPNVKDFLFLNAAVVALVVFYILRRRPRSPLKYSLKPSGKGDSEKSPSQESSFGIKTPAAPASGAAGYQGKSLNVIFNYNGHSWDAYEVLGIPAGSSLERVKSALEEGLKQVDPESRVFLETAFQAILTHLKS
jgi:hypothetical protein